jgi:hypothetical protein
MNKLELRSITRESIINLGFFSIIKERMMSRAKLGYNYVKLDKKFIKDEEVTDFEKIIVYLKSEGFDVNKPLNHEDYYVIRWDL